MAFDASYDFDKAKKRSIENNQTCETSRQSVAAENAIRLAREVRYVELRRTGLTPDAAFEAVQKECGLPGLDLQGWRREELEGEALDQVAADIYA